MPHWNLGRGDPRDLQLVSDARLSAPTAANDPVWRLSLGGGEPAALALETTFGLRARQMRLFPRFVEAGQALTDPAQFTLPPRITEFFPNALQLTCSPFIGIDVLLEVWVPEPSVITGRIQVANHSIVPRQIQLEWAAQLLPLADGQAMGPESYAVSTVLAGRTGSLEPVLFFTGGPAPSTGPYPALSHLLELPPNTQRQFRWAMAACDDALDSFELARQTTARSWEAELARVRRMLSFHLPEISTGRPDWDAALAFSQQAALRSFYRTQPAPPAPIFAGRRAADNAPARGTALELLNLADALLPGAPHLVQAAVLALLEQPASSLAEPPLLAQLAWHSFQHAADRAFLARAYPLLRLAFNGWADRDGDGFPEWSHPLQAGLEGTGVFGSGGADLNALEEPGLAALLAMEAQALAEIARVLGNDGDAAELTAAVLRLKEAVESTWDGRAAVYRCRDRDTHALTGRPRSLGQRRGPGSIQVHGTFSPPIRLTIQVQQDSPAPAARRPVDLNATRPLPPLLTIRGRRGRRAVEEAIPLSNYAIQGSASITSQGVFDSIQQIEIQRIGPKDAVRVRSASVGQDSLLSLLPLAAGLPDAKRAERLVRKTILARDRYGRDFGLPMCAQALPGCRAVILPWNGLIIDGLLRYGYRTDAAVLYEALMEGIVANLRQEGAFFYAQDSQTGAAIGQSGSLAGTAPVGLFLRVVGVEIRSPTCVILRGANPFPWPITVKYRGLTVIRREQDTQVIFPNGQETRVSGGGPHRVTLE